MALDTANKRYSMIGFDLPGMVPMFPVPDGSITAHDRAMLLGLYFGLDLSVPVPAPSSRTINIGGTGRIISIGGGSGTSVGGGANDRLLGVS